MREIIKKHNIESVCMMFQDSMKDINEGYRLLDQAARRLSGIDEHAYVVPRNPHCTEVMGNIKDVETDLKGSFWRYLLDLTQVKEICSIKKKTELDKMVWDDKSKLPDVTIENVWQLVEDLQANVGNMFFDALKEVFQLLTPRSLHTNYKTNSKFKVGKKAILTYMVENNWGDSFSLRCMYSSSEAQLQALDNVFSMIDGKGVTKYPNDLVTVLKTAMQNKEQEANTEYFRCKWFKNGNMHIEFKRMDLVKELNLRGSSSDFREYQASNGSLARKVI